MGTTIHLRTSEQQRRHHSVYGVATVGVSIIIVVIANTTSVESSHSHAFASGEK